MSSMFGRMRDRFFGRGHAAITVPPLDGVLRPNTVLDQAPALASVPAPDHLQSSDGALWFSSGNRVCRLSGGTVETAETFGAAVTGFVRAADGRLLTARLDGGVDIGRDLPDGIARRSVTGLAIAADGGCLISVGSQSNPADAWARDLLQGGATGSLWHIPPHGAPRCLARGLAWPERPLAMPDGSVVLSESSAARVLRLDPSGRREVVLAHLPGYPAGIARVPQGFALCLKAPRNQLIEFILREPDFCAQMIGTVPRDLWLAPSLHPPTSFREPLQGGALKQLGIMKPWAPSRSSGLVIGLDDTFVPRRSQHSRSDGTRHGTVSCAPHGDGLAVASWGAGQIIHLGNKGMAA